MHSRTTMRWAASLLALVAAWPSSATPQPPTAIAFTGVEIHDGRGQVLSGATLVIRGDRVEAVRSGGARAGERAVDLSGRVVIPGLIDANSSLLAGHGFNYEREDPVLPNLRVQDGIETLQGFHAGPISVATGLTVAYLSPGAWRPIGGQGVILRLDGETVLDMKIPGTSFVHFSVNEGALFAPGRGQAMPQTHMGLVALIRSMLLQARTYATLRRDARGAERPAYDPDLEVLAEVLSGRRTARIDVDTAEEIVRAISLAEEFGIRPVLEHCTEAYKVRDLLARERLPVVMMPFTQGNVFDLEVERQMLETPGWLAERGVPVAFQTFGHGMPPYANLHPYNEPRSLLLDGILQVRAGMDPEQVLRSVTSTPAQILGIADRVGSLRPGMLASFIVLDGPPFEYATRVREVWIAGRRVFSSSQDPIIRR